MDTERKNRLMAKYKKPPSKPAPQNTSKKPDHHAIQGKNKKKTVK